MFAVAKSVAIGVGFDVTSVAVATASAPDEAWILETEAMTGTIPQSERVARLGRH